MGMLEASGVTRRFGGMRAVDDVSFAVPLDGITGLIGPNGAGKTTMFNLLAGSLAPTRGTIRLDGKRLDRLRADQRVALGIGRTFQIPRPFAAMSVLENVLLGAQRQSGERFWWNWLSPRRIEAEERANIERAEALIEFVALGRLARAPARMLSGGQRKLLELARALMTEPRLLLLDEPAAGVAPALLDTIADRILALNARGIGFLVIEHNMEFVARLCRRVMVMASGRLLRDGTPGEVLADAGVVDAFLGGAA
ncbi:MAG: ABC transporter ATP-binding protein [Alphaproteobacteria bacterium]|nr:ABC transporter ATP-binding protein [Alphaproteobacteria bacterium]